MNRVAVASDDAQPGGVPPVQRPERHHASTTSDGESNYNSLQVTLSRQTSRNLQYFVAYTYGKTRGTLADEYR